MICQKCAKEGLKSTISEPYMRASTCMSFTRGHYDENGDFIKHEDPNYTSCNYKCSNGHEWGVRYTNGKCVYDGNK